MVNKVDIVTPTDGSVTITLNYETASALARVLGIVNSGVARDTGLQEISQPLFAEFGNNDKANGKYRVATVKNGQIHVFEAEW